MYGMATVCVCMYDMATVCVCMYEMGTVFVCMVWLLCVFICMVWLLCFYVRYTRQCHGCVNDKVQKRSHSSFYMFHFLSCNVI